MTPQDYLEDLASKLNLTDEERQRISEKHNDLRQRLREELPVEDDFLTGSYPRNTLIRPKGEDKFDVDFFLAFSNDDFGEYELPELIEMVNDARKEIKQSDPEIQGISEQNRSIAVEYDNGFQIDVVPAIEIEKNKLYKIFDKRTRQPVESNPKLHGERLSEDNEATQYRSVKRLVPIIKLLKSWKRDKCDYVKSFHLELLATEILRDEPIETYSSGLTKFFSTAGEYLQSATVTDPANEENIIDAYLDDDGTRQELLDLIAAERETAELAYRYESEGDYNRAVSEWKEVFESDDGESGGREESISGGPTIIARPPKQHCNVQISIE
jgi:hypothetical protein